MIDILKLLEEKGYKYDELTEAEKDTYQSWIKEIEQKSISLEDIKRNIRVMRESVENELTKDDYAPQTWFNLLAFVIPFYGLIKKYYEDRKDLGLKMRLRNYLLLEAFLTSQERAKDAIEAQLRSIPTKQQFDKVQKF